MAMGENSTIGVPINRTTSFSSSSPAVYSWLNFTNVPGPEQNVTFAFLEPDGTLYYNATVMIPDPGYRVQWPWWTAATYINIAGYPAANVTGAWKVDVYVDGRLSLVQSFTIS